MFTVPQNRLLTKRLVDHCPYTFVLNLTAFIRLNMDVTGELKVGLAVLPPGEEKMEVFHEDTYPLTVNDFYINRNQDIILPQRYYEGSPVFLVLEVRARRCPQAFAILRDLEWRIDNYLSKPFALSAALQEQICKELR